MKKLLPFLVIALAFTFTVNAYAQDLNPAPAPDPDPAPAPDADNDPAPAPDPDADADPAPAPDPDPAPAPDADNDPAPAPDPDADADPAPAPDPNADPESSTDDSEPSTDEEPEEPAGPTLVAEYTEIRGTEPGFRGMADVYVGTRGAIFMPIIVSSEPVDPDVAAGHTVIRVGENGRCNDVPAFFTSAQFYDQLRTGLRMQEGQVFEWTETTVIKFRVRNEDGSGGAWFMTMRIDVNAVTPQAASSEPEATAEGS